jgi:parvulin-like peptidyl-prolyl isomerase
MLGRQAGTKILLLCMAVLLLACQQEQKPLIQIDQRRISLDDFRQVLKPLRTELIQLPAAQQNLLLRQALSQLIDQEILISEAQKRGIGISEQELQQATATLRGAYTALEYEEVLRSSGQEPQQWLQQLRIRLLSEKVASEITRGQVQLEPNRLEDFYLQHLEDYRHPEQLRVRQILLTSEDEALRLRARLQNGESFAALAQGYSLSPERVDGGDLGFFARGQFPPEVDKQLFDLPAGQVSRPIKSPYGVHLFLVEERLAARTIPLEEIKSTIINTLKAKEETRLYQQWLHSMRERSDIRIDWQQLDKLHFDRAE